MKQKMGPPDNITPCSHDRDGTRKINKKPKKRERNIINDKQDSNETESKRQNEFLKSDIIIPSADATEGSETLKSTIEDVKSIELHEDKSKLDESAHESSESNELETTSGNGNHTSNDSYREEINEIVLQEQTENKVGNCEGVETREIHGNGDIDGHFHVDVGNVDTEVAGKGGADVNNMAGTTMHKKADLQPIAEEISAETKENSGIEGFNETENCSKTNNEEYATDLNQECSKSSADIVIDIGVSRTQSKSKELEKGLKDDDVKIQKQSETKEQCDDSKEKTTKRRSSKVRTKKSVSKRPHSVMEIRKSSYDEQSSRRPYSARETRSKSADLTSSPRRNSRDPFRFTKRELEWYLPRKSNFDCHDKTLKDAGHETEENVNRLEKMKQRINERLKREREARIKLQVEKGIIQPEKTEEKTDAEAKTNGSIFDFDKPEDDEAGMLDDENIQTLVQEGNHVNNSKHTTASRKHTRTKKKGLDDDDDDVKVEYQPLVHYLKYVKDNENDFHHHRRQSLETEWVGVRPDKRTMRMAQIIERRNRTFGHCTESVLVQAVQDIRPRVTDPGQWTIANKERNLMNNLGSFNAQKGPAFTPAKQENRTHESDQNTDEVKSEFEKEKAKLDRWLKTLSTAQIVKAKELALKDLGEEDKYHSNWWSTLRTCSYLRQKGLKHPDLT